MPGAGKAADSAALVSLHRGSLRPSSLQHGFTNPSASLSLKARSHDLDSGESSGVHASARYCPDAFTSTPPLPLPFPLA